MAGRLDGFDVGQSNRIRMLPLEDVGGAFVRRQFSRSDGGLYRAGERLDREQLLSIRNCRKLAELGFLDVFPASFLPPVEDVDHFLINRGNGKYDVIAGRKLNDAPLTKEQAEELAEGRP